ncbi:MAG: CpXC domain-containing protein, partial [Anaerolineales bacterium]
MPSTQISCPNCRQPVVADVDQLFDASSDPSAKQKLLSGAYNLVQCPHCGFAGSYPTPIVYHDAAKELLLTFFPPEVGVSRDEQERIIGGLINQAVDRLPQEERKAYLLRPEGFLTLQSLVERILEADGITKEMIDAQQQRIKLIERFLSASQDSIEEIAKQEDELIDADFFVLLSRLGEASLVSGDENSAKAINDLQLALLPITTYGQELQEQTEEIQATLAELQKLGPEMTRDQLLELVVNAPNENRVKTLVTLARPGMDYEFFRLLSERIDRARGDGRTRLIALREQLLELTSEIDKQIEARTARAQQLLNSLMETDDPAQTLAQNPQVVDEFFVQELENAREAARNQGDLEKIGKLNKMEEVLESMSAAPPEVEFIQELIESADDSARRELLEKNQEKVTPEFLDTLMNVSAQVEAGEDKELAARVSSTYKMA